ncbi:MAG: EcsC family protein [Acidobacteriia bacterium]|nr:EcsC family protein [Terriglobia bacterium]
MQEQKKSWLRLRVEDGLRRGLTQAYETVRVDPQNFLVQLRTGYGLPISTYDGVFSVSEEQLDRIAIDVILSGMKIAAVEGAGLGLGGPLTIVPDLSILAGITIRTVQKLSLIYGFQYATDAEVADLWVAAASAAGVDISRELLEKEVVNRFVPRVIQRIAVQASGEIVERWAGRLIPVVSSAIGATLNYYFVRTWGRRAMTHFRQKHDARRSSLALAQPITLNALPPYS